jgi:hypothetical protein
MRTIAKQEFTKTGEDHREKHTSAPAFWIHELLCFLCRRFYTSTTDVTKNNRKHNKKLTQGTKDEYIEDNSNKAV